MTMTKYCQYYNDDYSRQNCAMSLLSWKLKAIIATIIILFLEMIVTAEATDPEKKITITDAAAAAAAEDHQLPPDDPHFSIEAFSHAFSDLSSCSCNHKQQNTINNKNQCIKEKEEKNQKIVKEARIFYLVGIHNQRTLDDAIYLFRAIRDPKNIIFIHIDTKFGLSKFPNSTLSKEIDACPCGSIVHVDSVHDAQWGEWSMNLPTLWAMSKAVNEFKGRWDVFVNLSGDSLPVYNVDVIAKLLGGPLAGINFVTSNTCESGLHPTPMNAFPKKWHKRKHYEKHQESLKYVDQNGKHHYGVTPLIHFGSQWMTLQPEFCEYIITELDRKDSLPSQFRDYLIRTHKLMADETFFSTMLVYNFAETLPKLNETDFSIANDNIMIEDSKIFDVRYERLDEHYPSSSGYFPINQRYDVPESAGFESPRIWGPYFLGVYDLRSIRESGALYIRKVSSVIDPNMFSLLPVDSREDIPLIGWPKEVKLSEKPDWEGKKARIIAQWRRDVQEDNDDNNNNNNNNEEKKDVNKVEKDHHEEQPKLEQSKQTT